MSDTSDLPPGQEAVRRRLADARHVGPPPPEVVARLDETLAALVAERGTAAGGTAPAGATAPVVDLAARRRRRVGVGLLAAASVVVAGVALGQVLPRGAGDAGESASSDSSMAEAPAESGAGSEPEADDSDAGSDPGSDSGNAELPESLRSTPPTPFTGYPTLTSTDADLEEQVLDLRPDASAGTQDLGSLDALGSCSLPNLSQGRRLLAVVDGDLGIVVFRRPDDGTQQADVFVCGTPAPVRTLTLPAP